jgi:hypothetical protein
MTLDTVCVRVIGGGFIALVIYFYLLMVFRGKRTVDNTPVRRFYIAVYEGSDWEVKAIPIWTETEPKTPAEVSELTGVDTMEMDGLSIYGWFDIPDTYERAR